MIQMKFMLEKVYYQWIFSFMLILFILNTYLDIHSLFHIRKSINLLECPNMFGISWISFQSHNKRKDFFNETQSYNARSTIKWTQNFSRNVTQQLVCGITPDLSFVTEDVSDFSGGTKIMSFLLVAYYFEVSWLNDGGISRLK